MFTIRYSTEDCRGRPYFSSYTADNIKDANEIFKTVCSSLRSDYYANRYSKFEVWLMSEDILLDKYGLSD